MAVVAVGCQAGPGESIAAAVEAAHLPYVDRVEVSPKNPFQGKDHEDVFVYLAASATDDEVRHVWCDVILPAGPDSLGGGRVVMYLGTVTYSNGVQSGGERLDIPTCPGGTPSGSPA